MPKPLIVRPEDRARALNVVGEKITVLASCGDTNGYELFHQEGTTGVGPPPHSHDWDESFFVVEGDISFGIEEREIRGKPGTLVYVPAGTEHWFRFETPVARMLSVTGVGSDAAAFFTDVDAQIADGADLEGLARVAGDHHLRINAPAS